MTTAAYTSTADEVDVVGLLERPTMVAEVGVEVGVIVPQATFICRSIDLPDDATEGDTIVVDEITFAVRAVLPDGTGMTHLRLQRVP